MAADISYRKEQWKKRYMEFLQQNLSTVTTGESLVKTFSYVVAGRLSTNHSAVIAELLYSSSNLVTLFHDYLLRKHHNITTPEDAQCRWLKLSLAALDCVEVFIEIAAKKYGGPHIRWILIFAVELVKAVGRFMLLFKYKSRLRTFPVVKKLNRKTMDSDSSDDDLIAQPATTPQEDTYYTLSHSGRKVKSITEKYRQTQHNLNRSVVEESILEIPLTQRQIIAESLHNLQPLVHLFTGAIFSEGSWFPWLASLASDITSLKILQEPGCKYSRLEQKELLRRKFILFMYLLRSPCYDKYTKIRILRLLNLLSKMPGLGFISRAVAAYLPEWQSTYFYTWSS